jgi:Fe-S-cluster containining protein
LSVRTPPPAYAELVARVDAFDARVQAAQGLYLRCAEGCDACCRQRRTAFPVEVDAIRLWLSQAPPALVEALRARRDDPEVRADRRCVYLNAGGRCDVYAARPLLCRTHGPAIRSASLGLSFCALNFEGMDAAAVDAVVPADGILNLDLLTRMLVLIDAQHRAGTSLPARQDLEEALTP